MMKTLHADAVRTEVLKVRFAPDEDDQFRKFCNSLGMARATVAYKLAMDAMSAHVRPRIGYTEGAIKRPLGRQHTNPGSRARMGGAMSPRLRV